MMPHTMTADFSRFGYWELTQARDLLTAFLEGDTSILGAGITINFNTHSGCVFLSDEDYQVAMIAEDGSLRKWYSCPQCGAEGFDGDSYDQDGVKRKLQFEQHAGYCSQECAKEGGVAFGGRFLEKESETE